MFDHPVRTQAEVRRILAARGWSVSRTRIWQMEQRALAKLRACPELEQLAREYGLIPDEVTHDR
jgi:DNA-directed RNA polymerase sigma subunit (sigma70/sigma32)